MRHENTSPVSKHDRIPIVYASLFFSSIAYPLPTDSSCTIGLDTLKITAKLLVPNQFDMQKKLLNLNLQEICALRLSSNGGGSGNGEEPAQKSKLFSQTVQALF